MVLLLLAVACGGSDEPAASSAPAAAAPVATEVAAPEPTEETGGTSESEEAVPETGSVTGEFQEGGTLVGAGETPVYGGILTLSHRRDLPTSDHMVSTSISVNNVTGSMYGKGNLVRPSRANVFVWEGFLAESWEVSDDSTVYTFKIKPGITWHDGTPFTASDVVFWTNLSLNPESVGAEGRAASRQTSQFGPVESVEAVDALTVRYTLSQSAPNWLEKFFNMNLVVSHPKHLVQPHLDAGNGRVQPLEYNMVALGSFKFKKYDKGSLIQVRRYEDYFEKDDQGNAYPYLDGIDFVIMRDHSAMVSAFRANRLDGTSRGTGFHLIPIDVDAIRGDLGDKAWFARYAYLGWGPAMNTLKPPLDDFNLRKAIHLYVDRQEGIELVHGGFAVEAGIMPPSSDFQHPELKTWRGLNPATKEEDKAEAKKILKDSGYEGLDIEVMCRDVYLEKCEFMDAQFRALGLNPSLNVLDVHGITEATTSGNFTIDTRPSGGSNPGDVEVSYVTTNPFSAHKHGDTHIDDVFSEISQTSDQPKRYKLAQEIEKYVIDEKIYFSAWWWEVAVVAYRSHVKGVWIPGVNTHNLNDYTTTWIDPVEKKR